LNLKKVTLYFPLFPIISNQWILRRKPFKTYEGVGKMPIVDLNSKQFDEENCTKLEIFEKYLKEWLPVFIHSKAHDRINICDFFAGSSEENVESFGNPKSILRTIDTYVEDIIKNKLQVNILLNDKVRPKIDCLRKNLSEEESKFCKLSNQITISYYNEEFDNFFDHIREEIQNQANILFIDRNGLKYVTKQRLLDLDMFSHTDYLFYCSASFLIRFEFADYFPDFKLPAGCKKEDAHGHLLKYYRSLIPKDSRTKLYPFTIKKKNGVYGLIFGSKNPIGVEKFLQVAWDKNSINGTANFDIFDDSPKEQLKFDFEKKATKLEKFENDLRHYILSKKEITNKEIYYYTLEKGFTPKHAYKVVKNMKTKKLLETYRHAYINYENVVRKQNIVKFYAKRKRWQNLK
jgi:three-Cys-motif partner protein